jgi:hypothetical protein
MEKCGFAFAAMSGSVIRERRRKSDTFRFMTQSVLVRGAAKEQSRHTLSS